MATETAHSSKDKVNMLLKLDKKSESKMHVLHIVRKVMISRTRIKIIYDNFRHLAQKNLYIDSKELGNESESQCNLRFFAYVQAAF